MTHVLIADERISLDERGLAYIDGTRIKVLNIAEETGLDRSPQEIQEAHPHLTLAQIHAALSYYYSHQAKIDAEIERRRQFGTESRTNANSSTTLAELQAKRVAMEKAP